jgi:hypothetical protein
MVLASKHFIHKLRGLKPSGGVRIHIAGVDLIRDPEGKLCVLEDNLRTPSGVSYVLENRTVTKRVFQHAMEQIGVRRVDEYPYQLASALRSVSPEDPETSTIVVLTPGPFNSAYFEHSFLARSMGLELVEASDLYVDDDKVFVRTTKGPRRVHVIYRRTDDAFLDPTFFRPDSLLGVPGLMKAFSAGNVALANAPGNGVADDKATYAFVPDIIKYYLGEESILGQVPTYVCARPSDKTYVLEHLGELVIKAVDEAGGYGMLMGPSSTATSRNRASSCRPRRRGCPRRNASSLGASICGRSSSRAARDRGSCQGGSPVSPCAKALTSSTRARAAARKTPGSNRGPHDLARRRSLLLAREVLRAGGEHIAAPTGDARPRLRRRVAGARLLASLGDGLRSVSRFDGTARPGSGR